MPAHTDRPVVLLQGVPIATLQVLVLGLQIKPRKSLQVPNLQMLVKMETKKGNMDQNGTLDVLHCFAPFYTFSMDLRRTL